MDPVTALAMGRAGLVVMEGLFSLAEKVSKRERVSEAEVRRLLDAMDDQRRAIEQLVRAAGEQRDRSAAGGGGGGAGGAGGAD